MYFGFVAPLNAAQERLFLQDASPPAAAFRHRQQSHSSSGRSPAGSHSTPPGETGPRAKDTIQ